MIAEIVKNRVGICTEDHFSALVQQEKCTGGKIMW